LRQNEVSASISRRPRRALDRAGVTAAEDALVEIEVIAAV